MIIVTPPKDRGQGSLEYLAALAVAAMIIVAVAAGLLAQGTGVRGFVDSTLCRVFTLGTGACGVPGGTDAPPGDDSVACRVFGADCAADRRTDGFDPSWYCARFGVGCDRDGEVDLPEGLDPDSDLVRTLRSTPRGRLALQWLADNDVPIKIDSGETGAYWDGETIVLGEGYADAPVFVHEANHARYDAEGWSADAESQSRDDYVHGQIDEEAYGTMLQIRTAMDLRDAGQSVGSQPGESAYTDAYEQAISDGKPVREAERLALVALTAEYYNGGIVQSTDGKSYDVSYGEYWDSVN